MPTKPTKKELAVAAILRVLLQHKVKLDSPYAVDNWLEENMTHENMRPFFYKDERDIDVSRAVSEVLKHTPR